MSGGLVSVVVPTNSAGISEEIEMLGVRFKQESLLKIGIIFMGPIQEELYYPFFLKSQKDSNNSSNYNLPILGYNAIDVIIKRCEFYE